MKQKKPRLNTLKHFRDGRPNPSGQPCGLGLPGFQAHV